jgi:hypothetical protein
MQHKSHIPRQKKIIQFRGEHLHLNCQLRLNFQIHFFPLQPFSKGFERNEPLMGEKCFEKLI